MRVICIFDPALTILLFSTTAFAQITQSKPMPHTVRVQVDATGNLGTVSPHVFGTFIEPIDYSINNGVIAEILVNGSLESGLWNHAMLEQIFRDQPELIESTNQTGVPIPWQSLNRAAGNRFELHVGSAANSWQSLEIMGTPDELTGIKQRVYLPVPRTYGYKVGLYARHVSGPSQVNISLRSRGSNTVLAVSSIDATKGEWQKYTAKLELKQGDVRRLEPVDFAVSVEGDESVEVDQISLMPDDAVGTFDPDVVRMADAIHMAELRLGGNFSSYYHWRDGIGPLDKRIVMENIAWGIPEYNNFGTDEFIAFCKLLHVEPQLNLNMGSGTPQEAVDWIRYVRDRYHGPLIFEMGNELYGKWQVGYPNIHQIAPRTLAFSQALKPVSKDSILLATGESPDAFEKWNAAQLTNLPGTFDLLTTHFITGTNHVRLNPYTPDFMAAAAYAVPYAVGGNLDRMQAQVDAVPGYKGKLSFAVTEWLFNSKGEGERNFTNESPSSRNEGGAVMIASTFNTFFRHNEQVKLVNMTGLLEFAGIWKRREQVFASPAYYVFQMYSTAKGQIVLPVTTESGSYSVKNGTVGYADVSDVPYIDVVATRDEDKHGLTLFCVNRSLTDDMPMAVDIAGFAAQKLAKVEQVSAISRYVINDEVEPNRVVPQISSVSITNNRSLTITLPHESVTVVRLQGK